MEDILIWVDESDMEIGSGAKLYTHEIAQLHRAFSVFILDPECRSMLLQRRAVSKYHSGGLWSNACCSHPRLKESMKEAIRNRLRFELGIDMDQKMETTLDYCGSFIYRADFGTLSEHELDHVYACRVDPDSFPIDNFNRDEIEALKWIGLSELDQLMKDHPEKFSAWFSPALQLIKQKCLI